MDDWVLLLHVAVFPPALSLSVRALRVRSDAELGLKNRCTRKLSCVPDRHVAAAAAAAAEWQRPGLASQS